MMSRPAAFYSAAFAPTAIVGEGLIRPNVSDINAIFLSIHLNQVIYLSKLSEGRFFCNLMFANDHK